MVFGNEIQEIKKKQLYNLIAQHEDKIKLLKSEIEKIDEVIAKECIIKYGKHDFEREIEYGPYNESFWICKNCGFEH